MYLHTLVLSIRGYYASAASVCAKYIIALEIFYV